MAAIRYGFNAEKFFLLHPRDPNVRGKCDLGCRHIGVGRSLAPQAGRRQQVRVFLMDQSALSAIGNAYADEILFAARLHPKTGCHQLSAEQVGRLYHAVREVLAWGAAEVEAAGLPLEVKVRGHMRVRNRKGEPCPVCGTPIRRAGVLGHDAFFCPRCQATPQIRPPGIPGR